VEESHPIVCNTSRSYTGISYTWPPLRIQGILTWEACCQLQVPVQDLVPINRKQPQDCLQAKLPQIQGDQDQRLHQKVQDHLLPMDQMGRSKIPDHRIHNQDTPAALPFPHQDPLVHRVNLGLPPHLVILLPAGTMDQVINLGHPMAQAPQAAQRTISTATRNHLEDLDTHKDQVDWCIITQDTLLVLECNMEIIRLNPEVHGITDLMDRVPMEDMVHHHQAILTHLDHLAMEIQVLLPQTIQKIPTIVETRNRHRDLPVG